MKTPSNSNKIASSSPEAPREMFSLLKFLPNYKKYKKTVERVRKGDKLFEMSAEEIKQADLMGPWSLNIFESSLSTIPSLLLFRFLNFLFTPVEPVTENLSLVEKEGLRLGDELVDVIIPFLLPFSLMFIAWIAGWASLHHRDSNKAARKRAMYAYLYLDGSFGLFWQSLNVFSSYLYLFSGEHEYFPISITEGMFTAAKLIFFASLYGIGNEIYNKVRNLLFEINGYSAKRVLFRWLRGIPRDPNAGPFLKYDFFISILGGLGIIVIFLIVIVLCYELGYQIANLKY